MQAWKSVFMAALLLVSAACSTIAPTPLLMGRVDNLNTETLQLYVDCSEGANYVPTKEGCDPELLRLKTDELLDLSEEFISADIYQPHGYDVHLQISMIYFRIAKGTDNDYTRAEQIARQFFEIQKATGGHSSVSARFYLAWFTSARASYQWFNDPLSLDHDRLAELLLALAEGITALPGLEGPKAVRLNQALQNLSIIVDIIE